MFYYTGPRCQDKPFRVYVYPLDEHVPPSESYSKILNALKDSNYYTTNPEEACLFVLSLDTLDRDPLSNFDFVRNMPSRIAKLEHWNGGKVFFSVTTLGITTFSIMSFSISINESRHSTQSHSA